MSIIALQKATANVRARSVDEESIDFINHYFANDNPTVILEYIEKDVPEHKVIVKFGDETYSMPRDDYYDMLLNAGEKDGLVHRLLVLLRIRSNPKSNEPLYNVMVDVPTSFSILDGLQLKNVFEGTDEDIIHVFYPDQIEVLDGAYSSGVYFSINKANGYTFFYYTKDTVTLDGLL